MRLEVEYDLAENVFSICMVGPMVVLTSVSLCADRVRANGEL